jgi:death-on-curing protein
VKAWRWLEADELAAIHSELIAEFGGPPGLRDRGLLESAAARPRHLINYEQPTAFELAAAYAFGLARNHPFVDGNKRTALVAAFTFLELNGWEVQAEEAAAVLVFQDLAAGKLEENQLAQWLEKNSRPH